MGERWATFDCYGTLVDWNAGIGRELGRLFGAAQADGLLERYHELEPQVQAEDSGRSYREVLTLTLERLAGDEGLALPEGESGVLARSLPGWPVFAEVPAALAEARSRGWCLCVLSNSDRDLIDASMVAIGGSFDDSVVASEIGSYKPARGHWQEFERRHGRLPDAHVGASLFHDIVPATGLGLPSIWINRLGQDPGDARPVRELSDLAPLPEVLDELAAA